MKIKTRAFLAYTLFLILSTSASASYIIYPPMDEDLKLWIMGGELYYGNCLEEGMKDIGVEALNKSQSRYNYSGSQWCSLNSLNFSNLNKEDFPLALRALQNVKTFELDGNQLEDLGFLTHHDTLNNLYLDDNPPLYSLTALTNLEEGDIYLEEYKEYDLLRESSPFCQNVKDDDIRIRNNYDYNVCEGIGTETAWVNFIRDCDGDNYTDVNEFENSTRTFYCHSDGIYNLPPKNDEFKTLSGYLRLDNNNISDLESLSSLDDVYRLSLDDNNISDIAPLGEINTADYLYLRNNEIEDFGPLNNVDVDRLYITGNKTDNVDFMAGKTSIDRLDLTNNPITDTSGLSSLTNVGRIDIENTQIADIDGLENLTSSDALYIDQNNNLEDVTGLSNLQDGRVHIDDKKFETKMASDSTFCQNVGNGVDVRIGNTNSNDYKLYQICGDNAEEQALNASEWLAFFNDRCGKQFASISEAQNYTGTIYCQNKNLSVSDLPDGGLGHLDGNLRIYGNDLKNVDPFKDVTKLDYFYAWSNKIENVSGFSNLTEFPGYLNLSNNKITTFDVLSNDSDANNLRLNNNPLTDISGLSGLTEVTNNFYLFNTELANLNSLSNLTSVDNFHVDDNEQLTDISGIENINSFNQIRFDAKDYETKMASDSALCGEMSKYNRRGDYYFDDTRASSNGAENYYGLCDTSSEEERLAAIDWVDFFNNNCHTNYATYWHFQDGVDEAQCHGVSAQVPDTSLEDDGSRSIRLDFSSSGLDNLAFLENVNNVNHLELDNNNLSNIDELAGLEFNNLHLQNNNIDILSPLKDGQSQTANHLNVRGNNLNHLDGLEDLTEIDYLNASSNDLQNVTDLTNITSIDDLYIHNNPNLDDLSGLDNVTNLRDRVRLDNREYATKINGTSDVCVSSDDNSDRAFRDENGSWIDYVDYRFCTERSEEQQANAHAWQQFFYETCGRGFKNLDRMQNRNTSVNCYNKDLTNSNIPMGGLFEANNLYMNFSNNQLTDTANFKDFNYIEHLRLSNNNLSDITDLSGLNFRDLYLQDNNIADLTGLNHLTSVHNTLDLSGNTFDDVDPLSNVTSGDTLKIDDNSNLADVQGIQNANIDRIYIDSVIYDQRAPGDSSLCVDMKGGGLKMYVDGNKTYDTFRICDGTQQEDSLNADAWLKFFSMTCGQSFKSIDDLLNYGGTLDCSTNELVNSDLPDGGLSQLPNATLDFSDNQLTSFAPLRNITEVEDYKLDLNSNTDLSGLENLERINDRLDVSGENLTSLDGLDSLVHVGTTLDFSGTNISNLDGIDSLLSVPNFNISNSTISTLSTSNPLNEVTNKFSIKNASQLTSLDGISSIDSINKLDIQKSKVQDISDLGPVLTNQIILEDLDLDAITNKAPVNSQFCQDLRNEETYMRLYRTESSNWENVRYLDFRLCDQTTAESNFNYSEWLRFINEDCRNVRNGPLYNFDDFENNVEAECNSMSFVDADLPQGGGLQDSNLDLDLTSNNLDTLAPLSDISRIGDLRLNGNNSVSSLGNLSTLTTVEGVLNLSNMNNLNSLSGLDNLASASTVDLDGLTLPSLQGLGSLSNENASITLQNATIDSLDGLNSLTKANFLNLDNSNLSSLTGLDTLQEVSTLRLRNMDNFVNFVGATALSKVTSQIDLRNAPAFVNFEGASNLQTIEDINLEDADSFKSFKGLPSITSIDYINLKDANNFESFGDMTNLTNLRRIDFADRDNHGRTYDGRHLTDIKDISGIENASVSTIRLPGGSYNNLYPNESGKASGDGQLCNDLKNNNISIETLTDRYRYCSYRSYYGYCRRYSYGYRFENMNVDYYKMCTFSTEEKNKHIDDWVNFFNDKCNENINDQYDLNSRMDCQSDNLVSSDFPIDGGDPFEGRNAADIYLYDNVIGDLPAFKDIVHMDNLYFYNAGLTTINLSSLADVDRLLLNDNSLTSFDLSALTTVRDDLHLNQNNLTNVNSLSNLTSVNDEIKLQNNPNLDNIYGLRNIGSFDDIYLDDINFTTKAPANSAFCNKLSNDINSLRGGAGYYDVCESTTAEQQANAQEWLPFFNNHCRENFDFYEQTTSTTFDCESHGTTAADMPINGGDILTANTRLDFYDNDINGDLTAFSEVVQGGEIYARNSGIEYLDMSSMEEADVLRFYNNGMTAFDLSALTQVNQNLRLNGNNLTQVDTLSNLTTVGGNIYLNSNPDLDSVYGLRNLTSFNTIYLDDKDYTVKAPSGSNLCTTLKNDNGSLNGASYYDVCELSTQAQNVNAAQWLSFVDDKCNNNVEHYNDLTDATWDCDGLNITNNDFPTVGGDISTANTKLYMYNNDINGDFTAFRDVTQVYDIFVESSGITTVDLSSLQEARNVRFNNNDITSFDLSSLTTINENLKFRNNNLTNVNTLSNLTQVASKIYLDNNPNLTDLSGIANIGGFQELHLDDRNYDIKPAYDSPICELLYERPDKLMGDVSVSDVCEPQLTSHTSCNDIAQSGDANGDGTYAINPNGDKEINVQCDMTTDGGGWTKLTPSLIESHFSTNFTEKAGYGNWSAGKVETGDINKADGSDVIVDINLPFQYDSFFLTNYQWKDVDNEASNTWDLNENLTSLSYSSNGALDNTASDITMGTSQASSPTLSFYDLVGAEVPTNGKIVSLNNDYTIYNNPVSSSVFTIRANEGGGQNEDIYAWYQGAIWVR